MREFWNFFSCGRLHFGPGVTGRAGEIFHRRGWDRVFLVTDKHLENAGHVTGLCESLESAGCKVFVFNDGEPEPTVEVAISAIGVARAFEPDAIIGLGGGSNMDLAKIVSCGVTHGGHPSDYYGFDKVPGRVIPIICVPTTSGTGSEVTHAAVLTDHSIKLKVSSLSPYFRPTLALVDPILTVSCPKNVTAESGMDALTHAIEAYTNIHYTELPAPDNQEMPYDGKNPIADIFAEKAIKLIGEHLVMAVVNPEDLNAREGMALAASLAGLAFSNAGVALVHGLEYPIGGADYCSHGAGNALLLPYMMDFNRPVRQKEMADIANWLGVDTSGMTDSEASHAAIDKVIDLKKITGIPMQLRELGVKEEELPGFAEKTAGIERLMQLNPRKADKDALLKILTSAY